MSRRRQPSAGSRRWRRRPLPSGAAAGIASLVDPPGRDARVSPLPAGALGAVRHAGPCVPPPSLCPPLASRSAALASTAPVGLHEASELIHTQFFLSLRFNPAGGHARAGR